MKNKSKIYKNLQKDVKQFLTENGWKVYEFESEEVFSYLYASQLVEIPYKPKYLIEKDGQRMWAYYFWKGAYPFWRSKGEQITGFDWHKFQFMQGLSRKTNLPVAILFDSESQPEIIFRQLDQLPTARHSRFRKENCRRAYEPYAPLKAKCFHCWQENPMTYRLCSHDKKKTRTGMAVWAKNAFAHDTIIQAKLI